ncbi:hypothetical protein F4780DRAFT_763318 [Xylariomycetidae sp. FL0641]|nr:hypothetical protein F4780DRAFT_763318 [Xylariomycetidae sp. FL0641]
MSTVLFLAFKLAAGDIGGFRNRTKRLGCRGDSTHAVIDAHWLVRVLGHRLETGKQEPPWPCLPTPCGRIVVSPRPQVLGNTTTNQHEAAGMSQGVEEPSKCGRSGILCRLYSSVSEPCVPCAFPPPSFPPLCPVIVPPGSPVTSRECLIHPSIDPRNRRCAVLAFFPPSWRSIVKSNPVVLVFCPFSWLVLFHQFNCSGLCLLALRLVIRQ